MTTDPAAITQNRQLRQKVDQWVGQVFFGTLMKQVRESPFKSELFSGGRGGGAFQQMLDGVLIERSSHNLGGRLSDSIVRKLDKNSVRSTRYESNTPTKKPGTELAPGTLENELRRRGAEFRDMVVPRQNRILAATESRHGTFDRTV